MAKQTEFLTFLHLIVLLLTVISGTIIQRPLNAAMAVSEQTSINCYSNYTDAITWIYSTDCNSAVGTPLTDPNCNINNNYASHYRTEKPGGFVCNLIVFNALLSLGGCYTCTDGFGLESQYSAFLIVVDSDAIFSVNSTDVIAGDSITISNNVSYGGPSLQPPSLPPSLYWTLQSDPSQVVTSYLASITTSSVSSYIVVTVQPPNVPVHICNLFFNPPVNIPQGCASNTPTYRTSWKTPAYNVSQCQRNCPVTPVPDETAVIVLSVFLAFFILIVIGLVSWIVVWLLPKIRSLQASMSSRDENSSRQATYEVMNPNAASETLPYESLQQPTASASQEIILRHKSECES